jgi:hypothetical protein
MYRFLIISKPTAEFFPEAGDRTDHADGAPADAGNLDFGFGGGPERVEQIGNAPGVRLLGPKAPCLTVWGKLSGGAYWPKRCNQTQPAEALLYSEAPVSLGNYNGFEIGNHFFVPEGRLPSGLGLRSAYHRDCEWPSRLFRKTEQRIDAYLIFQPANSRAEVQAGTQFAVNPFCLEMDPGEGAVAWLNPGENVGGVQVDRNRVLHPGSLVTVIPIFQGSENDIRWRFLGHLWKGISSNGDQKQWPPVFRLLFAPGEEKKDLEEETAKAVEPFFALDLLGGTFVILDHGTGQPKYEWVPPEGMGTNGLWLARYFYQKWKGTELEPKFKNPSWDGRAVELAVLPLARPGCSDGFLYMEVPEGGVSEFLRGNQAEENDFEAVIVRILEGLQDDLEWGHFDLQRQSDGTVCRSRLLHDLARKALPASRILVMFPKGAETFAQPVAYEVQRSRFRGALRWARELTAACAGPPSPPNPRLDDEAPRRRGYGWWHQWAEWLTTLPQTLEFPCFSKSLRFNDVRTPLNTGVFGGAAEAENFVQAEVVQLNDEPIFW